MALKNIFDSMKTEGYVLKRLDQYLLTKQDEENDRRWDINSPSMASRCCRSIVYSRIGAERDANAIDARTQRIFDNGTFTHIRLQEYMLQEGVLLMDEVPVYVQGLQIQGHTDGILTLKDKIVTITPKVKVKVKKKRTKKIPIELGVLEIKSINSNGFSALIDAKEEHKWQAQIYMIGLEEERKRLKQMCKTEKELEEYLAKESTYKFYASMYSHLKDGNKYTREEKIAHKVQAHFTANRLLWNALRPITKIIFIYENKDTQEIKEFCVHWDEELVQKVREKFTFINGCVAKKKLPPREGTSKSCTMCRFCSFTSECWII